MENLLTELMRNGMNEKQYNDISENYSFGFNFIIRTTTKMTPKGKTTWNIETVEKKICTKREYNNATSDDTIKCFRRLGGTETVSREYTSQGYKIVKIVSTSPNKQNRTIREYEFLSKNFDESSELYLEKVLAKLKK